MASEQSDQLINRRRMLESVGVISITMAAGCSNESGGDDGPFPLDVRLETNSNNDDRFAMVELIAKSLDDTEYFNTEVEGYEFTKFTGRVLDKGYAEKGFLPTIGLSGTFNPGSFCDALHGSANWGQCCNLTGIEDSKFDTMVEEARFGTDVAEDDDVRTEKYDEIWSHLADKRYSSFLNFGLVSAITSLDVHNFSSYVFSGSIIPYSLYTPADEQVMWIDRENDAGDSDLSDLKEGGTFKPAVGANVKSFDPPYSSSATDSGMQGLVFEGLTTNDSRGNVYPWLAESYELVETQDIERSAYEDYMITVSVDEERVPETDGEQVIVTHPDDDPQQDDEVRVLTPAEAVDAVDDGTFGMQYRYNLHEGITFHNGEELTADNVVGTVERYENSDVSAQTFDSVLHARKVDEYTVDIYAQVVDAEAERELPGFSIHASEQIDLEGGEIDPIKDTPPIGTGPFEFESFEDEKSLTVTKYDDYWVEQKGIDSKEWFDGPSEFPDGPIVDAVEVSVIQDDSTRSSALQNGEIDMTSGVPSEAIVSYKNNDNFIVDQVQGAGYEYMQYPVKVEPWDDPRLRKAVNYLIPRKRIAENIYKGQAAPAWTPIPKVARGSGTADFEALESELKPKNEYKPEKAKELLEELRDEIEVPTGGSGNSTDSSGNSSN